MKNVIKPLVKSVLIPLGLTVVASAAEAGILKIILRSGTTTLIISNDEMEDIIKMVRYLEDSGLLLKEVSEKIQNEAKEEKGEFLSMLLSSLGTSLLGYVLTCNGVIRTRYGSKGKGVIRAGYESKGSSKSSLIKDF